MPLAPLESVELAPMFDRTLVIDMSQFPIETVLREEPWIRLRMWPREISLHHPDRWGDWRWIG